MSCQDLNTLLDGRHLIDVEITVFNGIDDFLFQHELFHVRHRYQDTLTTGKPFGFADIEKAFNFLVYTADWPESVPFG